MHPLAIIFYIMKELFLKINVKPNNKQKSRFLIKFINANFANIVLLSFVFKELKKDIYPLSLIKSGLVITQSIVLLADEWKELTNFLNQRMVKR